MPKIRVVLELSESDLKEALMNWRGIKSLDLGLPFTKEDIEFEDVEFANGDKFETFKIRLSL